MFRFAVSPGRFMRHNPMVNLQPPRADDAVPHSRVLTPKEAGQLLEAALASPARLKGELLAEWIAVTYLTFARKSEALRLTWDDIDFEARTVRIINDPEGRQHTKTVAERTVPMVPMLGALLQALPRHVTSPYVFFRRSGGRWREIKDGFAAAVERAELNPRRRDGESKPRFRQRYDRDKVTPHTLRHSALTLLAEHGTDRWDIMRWAGHKTTQATERYIHLARTRKRQIEPVGIDEIQFVDNAVFEAHVYSHVYSRAERSGRQ